MSDALWASVVSMACLLRSLPRVFGKAPRTPLRVLCIVALDTLHVLRRARPLPRRRIGELAAVLDFQACTNAAWDRKPLCETEYASLRRRLEKAGLKTWIEEYLDRLRELETRRPSFGGDARRFDEVRVYREAVARLSLATVLAIALKTRSLDEALRASERDIDVNTLFRIAMQCQIIDDVLDYTEDVSAGLPSFLTATPLLTQALESTGRASHHYAARVRVPSRRSARSAALPLRMALFLVSAATAVVVRMARRRHRKYILASLEEAC